MSGSAEPLSRSSRILDPMLFRLNIALAGRPGRSRHPARACCELHPKLGTSARLTGTIDYSNRVWLTLPRRAVEAPAILEFVRETIKRFAVGLSLQRYAGFAAGLAEMEFVRFSGAISANEGH